MKNKFSRLKPVNEEPFSEVSNRAVEMGMQERLTQINNELLTAVALSETVLSLAAGEGHTETNNGDPKSNCLTSVSYDILTAACNLRGNLERITRWIDPNFDVPKVVKGK